MWNAYRASLDGALCCYLQKDGNVLQFMYMTLSDRDIKRYIEEEKIRITPYPNFEEQLGPCSLDLHLGSSFRLFRPASYHYLDVRQPIDFENLMEEIQVGDDGSPFILQPNDFALAVTKETVTLPNDMMGRLDGKSSLGRMGIVVHSTAARFDPGWDGQPVLELGNLGVKPVILYSGMRICAMTFEQLSSPAENPYTTKESSKYKDQRSPSASRINKEFVQ